jgi:hypothetical protein
LTDRNSLVLRLGDQIRICRGQLVGLTGVVTRFGDRPICLLTIDGWPDGVYVTVSANSLERTEGQIVDAS